MKTKGISIRLHQVRCCNTVLLSLYIAVPKAPLNPIFNSDNYVLNFLQIFWRTWKAVCTCGKSPDKHGRLRLYFLISIWSEKKWLENISWRSKDVQLLPDLAFFSDLFLLTHVHRVIPQCHLYFCFSITLCSMYTWVSLSLPIAVRTTSLKNWGSHCIFSRHRICNPQHCLLHHSNLQIPSWTGPYVQGTVYISLSLWKIK